jgi:hypothetical protein
MISSHGSRERWQGQWRKSSRKRCDGCTSNTSGLRGRNNICIESLQLELYALHHQLEGKEMKVGLCTSGTTSAESIRSRVAAIGERQEHIFQHRTLLNSRTLNLRPQ